MASFASGLALAALLAAGAITADLLQLGQTPAPSEPAPLVNIENSPGSSVTIEVKAAEEGAPQP